MRSQNQWPEDPLTHLKDYFGNDRSPVWDTMEQMEEENSRIKESLPELEATIQKLTDEIEVEKRKTKVFETYKAVNVDGSVSGLADLNLLRIGCGRHEVYCPED